LKLAEARRFSATGQGRRLRVAARLSEGDVGRAIGTSHANVSRWENGERQPSSEEGVRWGQFIRSLQRRGFTDDQIAEAVR
jgi:DNA-binding transcriptional regulator YiaG